MASEPLLAVEGVSKRFPGVLANDDVSFSVDRGEIHALLGENGAGKSTLVKMIYGVMRPDGGSMRLEGKPYAPARPSEARAQGVGMVFQHFSLFEALTIAENIALGLPAVEARGDLGGRIARVSREYGLDLEPGRRVAELSVGERQRVEIVRCLLQNPRLLIMDEPTSVLTPQEASDLFATLRRLASENRSILYISHKLDEIRSLCHHATVLRGGKVVATAVPSRETARSLAEMMIATTLLRPERGKTETGATRLTLDRLSVRDNTPFGVSLEEISLEVRAGEIVGIAGVAGNGQSQLMAALIGEHAADRADSLRLDGRPIGLETADERRQLGMCCVPEERLGHATAADMSLAENTVLSAANGKALVKRGFLDHARARRFAEEIVAAFDVRTAGVDHAARSLSGGNLQKFIVGREVLQSPAVLIAAQPTWGVDAGAAAVIHRVLLERAAAGAAILVISQDLDELMAISTRIAVIAGGRLSQPRAVEDVTVEEIGPAMGGIARTGAAVHG